MTNATGTENASTIPFFEIPCHPQESFQMALERFVNNVNEYRRAYYYQSFPNIAANREIASVMEGGKKYIRIILQSAHREGRSVYCFIDAETGDVLKADGWKRPARGPRGSIYSSDWKGYGCSHNGPHYAR